MTSRRPALSVSLGLLVAACVVYCVALGHRPVGPLPVLLVLVAGAAWWAVVRTLEAAADPTYGLRMVVGAAVLVGTVAVVFPPRASDDVWSYAMYARMVTVHHANPYVDVPSKFPTDPIFSRVGHKWRSTPSRYGPVFTAGSALGSALFGRSALGLRLWFQGLVAIGVVAVTVLAWRRWRSTSVVAFIALQPLVVLSVLNGAHNDIFVVLGVFAGLLALERGWAVRAGLCIAGAALVKISALLALPAVCCWLWLRAQRRAALVVATSAAVPAIVASAMTPGCLDAIRSAVDINHSSVWFTLQLFVTRPNSFIVHGPVWSQTHVEQVVKTGALAVVAVAVVVATIMLARRSSAPLVVTVAFGLALFTVFGAWIVPWYLVWSLPLLTAWDGPVRVVVAAHAVVFLAAVHVPLRALHEQQLTGWSWSVLIVLPWLTVVAYGVALLLEARGRGRPVASIRQPSTPTGLPSII